MSHPLFGGLRCAGSWLPKLTTLFADGLAIVMAVLALFAGGMTSRGDDLPQSVVLDFTATWCQPCQQMSPIVHRLIQQGYAIRKVDVDQQKRLAQSFGISTIPTFVLIVDGEEQTRVSGKISEEQLRRLAKQAVPRANDSETLVAQPEPKRSLPLPVTPKEARNSAPEFEVTPFQADLGEPKVAPEATPLAVAETKERGGLLGKLKFPKFGSNRGKTEVAAASHAEETPNFRSQNPETEASSGEETPREPLSASVRLRVTDASGLNLGSGSIIDSRVGRTTIITCGHIFGSRSESPKAPADQKKVKVEVDLFLPNGKQETYVGKLISYNLDSDVGVVTIATAGVLPVAPLAPLAEIPAVRDRLVSIGCGGGEVPTQEPVRVTAINRYDGPDTVECTGVPVQGRSGGGLFDAQGQLVGVCFGADQEGQRGVYAGLRPIYDLLTGAGLQQILPVTPAGDATKDDPFHAETAEVAAAEPAAESRPPQDANFAEAFRELDQELFADETPPSSADLAKLFEESPDAEVICIVRSKQGGVDRVVILNQPSTKFVSYLLDSVDTQRTAAPRTASLRVEAPADRLGGEWEQDDSIGVPQQATDKPASVRPASTNTSRTKSVSRSRFGSRSAN